MCHRAVTDDAIESPLLTAPPLDVVNTMFTESDLLVRIAAPGNLSAPWHRVARKGSAGAGPDDTVQSFSRHAERELARLRDELLSERYVPAPLREIWIPKRSDGSGLRRLHIPAVRDKVAQQAVRQLLEPLAESRFLSCSFAYRERKGPVRAIRCVRHHHRRGRRWIATLDVRDFFDSIPLPGILAGVRALIPDRRVERLVELWCRIGAVRRDGRWRDSTAGVHQGNVLAPLLANIVLHPFDVAMRECGARIVRYADDILVLAPDVDSARRHTETARRVITSDLGLALHEPDRMPVALSQGFTFLGIRFEGDAVGLDPSKRERWCGFLEGLMRRAQHEPLVNVLRDFSRRADGWRRYYAAALGAEALVPMAHHAREVLGRCARIAADAGTVGSVKEAEEQLAQVTWLIPGPRPHLTVASPNRPDEVLPAGASTPQHEGAVSSVERAVGQARRAHYRQEVETRELLVSTSGAFLSRRGDALIVRVERREVASARLDRLRAVTLIGHGVSLSTDAASACAAARVPVVIVSPRGELVAMLSSFGAPDGEVACRQAAAVAAVRPALEIARRIVDGKVRNQLNFLKYLAKYRGRLLPAYNEAARSANTSATALREELARLTLDGSAATERARLMSVEGRMAAVYWEGIRIALEGRALFPGRVRRGARDLVNGMLNYGYAILLSRVNVALAKAGLTPSISFLHASQGSQPTLAYDLMEEFRVQVVDRAVVTILSRGEEASQGGDGLLVETSRRRLARAVLRRLENVIAYRGKHLRLVEVLEEQARHLVRHLVSGSSYRPFVGTW